MIILNVNYVYVFSILKILTHAILNYNLYS